MESGNNRIYLLHPMVLIPSSLLLQQWQANAFIGFLVVTTIALVGSLALAALLERCSVIRLVLGLKTKLATSKSVLQRAERDLRRATGMRVSIKPEQPAGRLISP